jgi:hypothetical protein
MVDSDIISDPEDNADHGADEEDDGEGWDTSAEDDDDDGDFDVDGDPSDEDGKKKRKSTKVCLAVCHSNRLRYLAVAVGTKLTTAAV